jgi:3D (Asp-Asp-Asp) domain-containing protein
MKLFYTVIFFSSLASAAFAREESILARVTTYWAGEGQKYASTGQRLRSGHCAVDPKQIPYGSKVVFPDRACTAVDTGPAVISRKAARLCGRTASQLKAIVVDRFFETKREAVAWASGVDECASTLYDASNCSARSCRRIRPMIREENDWIASRRMRSPEENYNLA